MLVFGTGGIRAIMGEGDDCINERTIAVVTHALARVINESRAPRSCAVAYDTRRNSDAFARLVSGILASYGIEVSCFDRPVPTPTLSYTIRSLKLGWGVVITASHNPKEYNGYKVYDHRGVQIVPPLDAQIAAYMSQRNMEISCGKFNLINELSGHIRACRMLLPPIGRNIGIVYSPLYGTGATAVPTLLRDLGFTNVSVVQDNHDSDFGGLYIPNPEEDMVYEHAKHVALCAGAEIICVTDPDCDRVGVMVRSDKCFIRMSGNQIAAVLFDALPTNPGDTLITTEVSGHLCKKMAQAKGVEVVNLPTGFKFIGDYAENLINSNLAFSYEESCGYLWGDAVRDKDALLATAMICIVASRMESGSLLDTWHELCKIYGYFDERLISIKLMPDMNMDSLKCKLESLALPSNTWLRFRMSGTEPKGKIYFGTCAQTQEGASEILARVSDEIRCITRSCVSDVL